MEAARGGGAEPAVALTRLLEAVAAVMPYPVLTRIVPGLLAQAAGDRVPVPEPPSPGAILATNLRRLASWCAAREWQPAALRDTWPRVDDDVADVVGSFCRDHSGFGPVAWEAPGFDSPRYTVTAMATLVPSPTRRDGTVDWHPVTACPDGAANTAHQVAVRWIEHMDRQIWLQRRAFHHGAVPLLAALGDENGVAPWRLLFAERSELASGIPSAAVLDERIAAYLSGTEYLTKAGIDLNRLGAIFGETEARAERVAPPPSSPPAAAVLHGTGASPGTVTGNAFVLRDDGDVAGLVPGSVLVVRVLHPYLAPALARASAVVVEEGGLLQHATILAREMGIPAVVGVRDAVALLGGAVSVHVEGTEGRVTLLPPPGDAAGSHDHPFPPPPRSQ